MTPRPVSPAFSVLRIDALSPSPAAAPFAGAVAAIGNFDGLHLGHCAVLHAARTVAEGLGAPTVMLTFEPHPRAYFRPDQPLFRLTPEPLKLSLAQRMGLSGAIVLTFDGVLAGTGAVDFISRLLIETLGLRAVAVGEDFHFGRGREGSPAMLQEQGHRLGLGVEIVPPLQRAGAAVSSSAIRERLSQGDVENAAALLGYRWIVRSTVGHGDKRGRTLGYPTANLRVQEGCGLRHGIYAVRIGIEGVVHDAIASYGRRPTFDDGAPLLEVFVFDFAGDLYGKTVDVEFAAWIRGEEKFESAQALVEQMDRDSIAARAALARPADVPASSMLPLPN